MRVEHLFSTVLLAAATASAGRSVRHAGKQAEERLRRTATESPAREHVYHQFMERQAPAPQFLNANTSKFVVNGSAIPDVDFDIGESYAGQLPISNNTNDPNKMFFWFLPSTNPAAKKEIVIWLNGGPGCSSLEGFIQENGPFLWQYGTFKPVKNPYSWHRLTNIVWVEQPIGTGFSTGTVTATSEDDIAAQFKGFWKNFVNTFSMQGYKVYIAGESYAGLYCPYIASSFLDEKDTTYFNMSGMLIYDPLIAADDVQAPIPVVSFVDYWGGLFPFNDTFRASIHARDKDCGYSAWMNKYLVYPPKGHIPNPLPGTDASGQPREECENIYNDIFNAILLLNPCFDIYQVATTCPLLWDVLGFPGSLPYLPDGASVYFDRADVKKAINAPNVSWSECAEGNVFVDGNDSSPPSIERALPHVIDATKNVIIAHGALDMILLANGTLLGIQNMTWGGMTGFQTRPDGPFYVPYHNESSLSTIAGAGVMGTAHTERGLTYVGVDISGHMVPQYAPTAAFRQLEFLLGRVSSLSSTAPFTLDPSYPQSTQPLGFGTAPQGWSSEPARTCNKRRNVSPNEQLRRVGK